jgi:glycosyltransferase involved in cell wall biosynthesis
VLVNTSITPSLDKVLLEAMACGVPVVTSNPAYERILAAVDSKLFVAGDDPCAVATAVEYVVSRSDAERRAIATAARELVVREHGLDRLVGRLVDELLDASGP